jgi:hypothetical protein
MTSPRELYDKKLVELIENVPTDLETDESTTAMRNLRTFSECRPPQAEPEPEPPAEPEPEPPAVPTTAWEKTKAGIAAVWNNETTRVLIKAGGTFAGVALVAWSTIHRDHVIERQALAQANQRPN